MSKEQSQTLRQVLQPLEPALAEARKLKDYPRGRYAVSYAPDWTSTPAETIDSREIALLLKFESWLLAHDGKTEEAWNRCLAILNTARAFGDTPLITCQLIRHQQQGTALAAMERVLGQGQVSDETLKKTQQELDKEAAQPVTLISGAMWRTALLPSPGFPAAPVIPRARGS
jgi:hypothetical protein